MSTLVPSGSRWSVVRKIINNLAGDCSISLKFRTDFDHVTLHIPHILVSTGQRSRSQRDITYQHKNAIIQARISCRRSNLVKIIPVQGATCYLAFKVNRSNIEIAITPPRIARLRSNLVQSFITSQAIRCNCSSIVFKDQRSKVKVTGSKIKVTA